jgi:glucose/arabinose dehydrogenase/PKD repeat protein
MAFLLFSAPRTRRARGVLSSALVLATLLFVSLRAGAAVLPAGFVEQAIGEGWHSPLGIAFDTSCPNNRLYVWERAGKVWLVENGIKSTTPLIDLSAEVMAWRDLGLLSVTLDPHFQENGRIYLLYAVDRHHLLHFGTPAYEATADLYAAPTIGRLTRYTARASDAFRTIDPGSRRVLLGESIDQGIPILHDSHGVGTVVFGADGTLLVSCGDGASYYAMDDGGADGGSRAEQAEREGIIAHNENIGAFRAQLPDSLNGKILRLDPQTGDGVPGNPYFDPANPRSARSRVWTLGLRNPYRMAVRPGSGSALRAEANPGVLYVGDVGAGTWEELDVIAHPGVNCGWPLFEGLDPQPEYQASPATNPDAPNPLGGFFRFRDLIVQATAGTPRWLNPLNRAQQIPASIPHWMHARPIIDYHHANNGSARTGVFNGSAAAVSILGTIGCPIAASSFNGRAATAGAFFSTADFPAEYRGAFFHADFVAGWIKAMTLTSDDRPQQIRPFASGTGPIVFLGTHPTSGALYYVTFNGNVRRIIYGGAGPRAPVAIAQLSPTFGSSPLTVHFDGTASYDPDGDALEYLWTFDDGSTSNAPAPVKTFFAEGTRQVEVTLRVTDAGAQSHTVRAAVFVNHAPPMVSVLSPQDGAQYRIGEASSFPLRAIIEPSAGRTATSHWQTIVHQGAQAHVRPAVSGPNATVLVQGEGAGTYYENVLTVADDLGLEVTKRVLLRPALGNAAPKVAWSMTDTEIAAGATTLLDPKALVIDDDSAGLEDGTLTIDLVGGSSNETLSLESTGEIEVDDGKILYRRVEIGTLKLANGQVTLTVAFNAAATPTVATAVLRRVGYRAQRARESPCLVRATLADGDGGVSLAADLSVIARAGNLRPSVQLVAPRANALLDKHGDVTLEARASDPDDGIARIDFFRGTRKLGSTTGPPFTWTWRDLPAGTFQVKARAVDRAGAIAWSAPVDIHVTKPASAFFGDNFDDRRLDKTKWMRGSIFDAFDGEARSIDSGISVAENNGHLEIGLPAAAHDPRVGGYLAWRARDLTNACASLEVAQVAAGNAVTRFAISKDAQNALVMLVKDGDLSVDHIVNGRSNLTGLPYVPAQHRFWRIRHESGPPATIAFEVSPDAITWQILRRDEAKFAIDKVRPEMSAGILQNEVAPGGARFDNFHMGRANLADSAEPFNDPPVARPGGPYAATVNIPVHLTAASSADPDGSIVSVQWRFPDGSTVAGLDVAKAFPAPGVYAVALRVTDDGGAFSEESATIVVEDASSRLPDRR